MGGLFGCVQGKSIVQRSFDVGAGHTPAVALVVHVATVQSEFSAEDLSFPSSSFVSYIYRHRPETRRKAWWISTISLSS